MVKFLSKSEYEENIAATRDQRMEWWREARYGMFIHYGLYTQLGRNEWAMSLENYPIEEYEKLADTFNPKVGAPREWAKLAKEAGMKYMVMTTRHHEGFSLWDSKTNPYNSVNYGPHRDIVKEFVEACREFDLKIGFYSTLMEWHHPDSGISAYDSAARKRFTDYLYDINEELLTNYGKIDILWYDVPAPMEHHEGWNSLELNQKLRDIQPDIIINDRSRLAEDFGTPEEHLTASDKDWEACMTFNGISWGYVDSKQAIPYSYNAQRILRMLNTVANGKGNLLLNIGPMQDGSVPEEVKEPLLTVGKWLEENGEALYGKVDKCKVNSSNGVCSTTIKGNTVYLWNWIWHESGCLTLGGFMTKLKNARFVKDNTPIEFEQVGHRILLKNMPTQAVDTYANVTTIALEFDEDINFKPYSQYPQLHGGRQYENILD